MKHYGLLSLLLTSFILTACGQDDGLPGGSDNDPPKEPPFGGTIFLDPDIITADDPSAFESITFTGQDTRTMFDRRVNDWITLSPYLFEAVFDDERTIEMQVNPEFGSESAALTEAEKYAIEIGRLPGSLRDMVQTSWIHKGTQPFGGGNNNILIHTGQADLYVADGILEETLVHEATHTSIDPLFKDDPDWKKAQADDPTFISTYARDYPDREDLAESWLLWMAIKYRSERISTELKSTIESTMPNRIAFFNSKTFELYPVD